MNIIEEIEKEQIAKLTAQRSVPEFAPGDTVRGSVKVIEGTRERVQAFEGVCIGRTNSGLNSSFTVRKISFGEGVERVFPLYSPRIAAIEVMRRGDVRRAKLYYLRGRTGKKARILEKAGTGVATAAELTEAELLEGAAAAPVEAEAAPKAESMLKTLLRKVTRRTSSTGIKVAGEDDVLVRFAKCCSPLPGDQITGFITRGRGVTVHRRDCDKGLDLDPERRIDVEWDGTSKTQHEVAIQVLCADKPGLLAHISQSFTDQGVNISQAHCRATEDGRAVNTFHALVRDLDQLKGVIRALSRIKGVFSVDRVAAEPT